MYGLSSDPRTSRANGIFGLMFGFLFLAMGVYVFANMDADVGVFLIAIALLGIMFNGYRAFYSRRPREDEFKSESLENYSPEVQVLILDRLKAEGYIDEEEYNLKRSGITKGS
jgi:hypothetical protein